MPRLPLGKGNCCMLAMTFPPHLQAELELVSSVCAQVKYCQYWNYFNASLDICAEQSFKCYSCISLYWSGLLLFLNSYKRLIFNSVSLKFKCYLILFLSLTFLFLKSYIVRWHDKSSSAHPQRSSKTMAGGGAQTIPCWGGSRPITGAISQGRKEGQV